MEAVLSRWQVRRRQELREEREVLQKALNEGKLNYLQENLFKYDIEQIEKQLARLD